MKLSEIKVNSRHRQDMGDVAGLAASIRSVGLLHPIVVDGDGNLIVGRRRLEAMKLLRWADAAVTVATTIDDVHKALLAERDENTCRKDFTPTEAVEMAKALEPFELRAAMERMTEAGRAGGQNKGVDKLSTPSDSPKTAKHYRTKPKVRAADKVAEAVGLSRHTLTKAAAVVEAAKSDPEHFGDLPAQMDETGKIDPAYQELVKRGAEHPLPAGKTPHQLVKESPARKWTEQLHRLWLFINSLHAAGNVEKLCAFWTSDERADMARQLHRIAARLNESATALHEWKPTRSQNAKAVLDAAGL